MFDRARTDLRDALRGLRGGRGTTLLAFVILSLTMAAGTVTFSVVDGVALRLLPYASPDRLVSISPPSDRPGAVRPSSPRDYFDWLESAQTLESLGAARLAPGVALHFGGLTETLVTRSVTANLFDVLGVRPAVGRFFGPEHEHLGGPSSVVLSHDLWVRRFESDPRIVGQRLTFGQDTREVVGVLSAGVSYQIGSGASPDIYVPWVATASDRSNNRASSVFVVGRLRTGVTLEQARAELGRNGPAVVLSLQDQVVGPAKAWLLLVLAAVGFVILVACANVANLLLARATTRAPELATREALGAPRRRLAAGLLLEGLLLALASAVAGLVLSFWGIEIVKSGLPPGLTRVSTIAVDGRVMFASMVAAALCGLLCASAPAWMASRTDLLHTMKASGGSVIGGRRRDRSLSAFLVADVAFVSVLLVATSLVVTTFILVSTADLGFDRRNVMTLGYERLLNEVAQKDRPHAAAALRADLMARASSVPGVTSVAISMNGGPLSGGSVRYSLIIPGIGETQRDDWPETNMVTPGYFHTMGMEVIRGRPFEASDGSGAPRVMLINDVAARRFFPDRDSVGQIVTFQGSQTTIIGVLRGVHFDGPEVEVPPAMYTPIDQFVGAPNIGVLLVRTTGDPRVLSGKVHDAIRPALSGSEPGLPRFIDDGFRRLTAGRRFNAGLMAIFGFIALAIGAIGVYGTTSFVVAQQIPAIGLRMTLGASPTRVLRSVLREALRDVALGVGIGLAGAWALSGALESFVFGIRATDPIVYAAVGGFLAVVGTAAAFVPAMRAARLDPLTALRRY